MQTNKNKEIPVYQQIIHYLKSGFDVLDETIQQEIIAFIDRQQHSGGGFTDRAGTPDLYYSLFGYWFTLATNNLKVLGKFESFIHQQKEQDSPGAVEQMALLLIHAQLSPTQKKQSLFTLFKTVFLKGKRIGLTYQFFLLTLAIDAQNSNKKLYYFLARIVLIFYKSSENLPCSITAALTFAKHKVGLKIKKDQNKLISYYNKSGGFRAFESIENSDTLSTAVALFVLRETNFDMRMITPPCLDFVQQNYDEGAFLSGDGDTTRDLEYTFYGLLALGTLIENGKDTEKAI